MQEMKPKNHQFIVCNPDQKSQPTSVPAIHTALERNAHRYLTLDINNLVKVDGCV